MANNDNDNVIGSSQVRHLFLTRVCAGIWNVIGATVAFVTVRRKVMYS